MSDKTKDGVTQEASVAFYNAAVKIVEAGALVMPYNNPLGTTIVKMAEALSDQVGMMTGLNKNENSQQSREIKLDEKIVNEIEDLENELAGELGDL